MKLDDPDGNWASTPPRMWSVLGFGGVFYPYVLPLIAVLSAGRVTTSKVGYWFQWIGAIICYAVVSMRHLSLDPDLLGLAVAFLTAFGFNRVWQGLSVQRRHALGRGCKAGLIALVVVGLAQVLVIGTPRASGPLWFSHPNVFAHSLIALGLGICTHFAKGAWARFVILAATMAGVVATGSRSGLTAAIVVLLLLLLLSGWRIPTMGALITSTVVLATSWAVFPNQPWAQRTLGIFTQLGSTSPGTNLLNDSDVLGNYLAWNHEGVSVSLVKAGRGDAPAEWLITRTGDNSSARPQQSATFLRGRQYAVSVELRPQPGTKPGILLWGQDDSGNHELQVQFSAGMGEPEVLSLGRFRSARADAQQLPDGWVRLVGVFEWAGDGSIVLSLGPTPDLSSQEVGATVQVRAFQVEQGEEPSPYQKSEFRTGRGEALARLPLWRVAIEGFIERPIFGRGKGSFSEYLEGSDSFAGKNGSSVEVHPHNQFLTTAFESGVVGMIGYSLLLAALLLPASQLGRAAVLSLQTAQLFDTTMFAMVVLLPLAILSRLPSANEREATEVD